MTSTKIGAEQKRETQEKIFNLRAYYPLHVIALECKTNIGVILDVINGHIINDNLWPDIVKGVNKLKGDLKK